MTYHTLGFLLQFPWGVFPISRQGNILNFETGTHFNLFWTMSGKFCCGFSSKVPLISWNFVRRLQTTPDSKRPFFWRLAEDRNTNLSQEIEWRIKLIQPNIEFSRNHQHLYGNKWPKFRPLIESYRVSHRATSTPSNPSTRQLRQTCQSRQLC